MHMKSAMKEMNGIKRSHWILLCGFLISQYDNFFSSSRIHNSWFPVISVGVQVYLALIYYVAGIFP